MNLIIPMAGDGQRFKDKGYIKPKPFIRFLGKTMIEHVLNAIPLDNVYRVIFICRSSQLTDARRKLLRSLHRNAIIVELLGKTKGAAETVLSCKEYYNNKYPIAILNSDNILDIGKKIEVIDDGTIYVFEDKQRSDKWSFVSLDENGYVKEVAEKKPISNIATAGLYTWKSGKMFIKDCQEMIRRDIKVNGEYYLAPVYNISIERNRKITIKYVNKMDGVGTPKDLQKYIVSNVKK